MTNLRPIRRVRLLEALWTYHLIDCIVVFWVFLVLLCFLVACLALVLGIFLGVRMTSVASNAYEISSISWLVVMVLSRLVTHIVVLCHSLLNMFLFMDRSLIWRVFINLFMMSNIIISHCLWEFCCKWALIIPVIRSSLVLWILSIHWLVLRPSTVQEMVQSLLLSLGKRLLLTSLSSLWIVILSGITLAISLLRVPTLTHRLRILHLLMIVRSLAMRMIHSV